MVRSLKTLVQNDRIEFDLFPFVRVNNRGVFGYEKSGTGILFSVWGENNYTPDEFARNVAAYSAKPDTFFSADLDDPALLNVSFVQMFRKLGVRSLALTPVFYARERPWAYWACIPGATTASMKKCSPC